MTAPPIVPVAPRALPLLGHLPSLVRDPLGFFRSLPESGDLVQIRLGPARALVVCDPGLTWQVLSHDRLFDKGGLFIERARDVFGDGLGTCPHSLHRRQRRLAQPAFHHQRMPAYAQVMIDQITEVTDAWRPGQALDVLAETTAITSTVTSATMFADTLSPEMREQALADLTVVLSGIIQQMVLPAPANRLPTPGLLRYRRASARLRETLREVISTRRASPADHGDLLSALLAARDIVEDGNGLSDSEVLDEAVSFFFAATDTTASTLAWALHLLSQHPGIRASLYAEVDSVLAGRAVSYDDVPKLELTRRIITETLRLWPAGWMFTRITTDGTELGGFPIPADTTLVYSPYLIHHHPGCYDEPDRFDPDRWLPERRGTVARHAYIPFGGGARKCIGEDFGLTQATLALAAITSRWNLRAVPGRHVQPSVAAVIRPKGLQLIAEPRPAASAH